MKKRIMALMLCASMTLGLLTGCGGGTQDAGSGPAAGSAGGTEGSGGENAGGDAEGGQALLPEDDPDETISFSIWTAADDYKHYNTYNDNPVVQELNEMFNVKMEFQLPAIGAEMDNFNLMIGTGDYTDLINTSYSTDGQSVLYEDGVIIDIAPYIEKYMPNYYAILQENEELRKLVYDDEGHAFGMFNIDDLNRNQWGGLVYRRDILETMTGGNVAFPSGNEDPVTVEDWEYMLPLMKQYFDNSGIAETACLVIPACGYILTGELAAGFGTSGTWQLSKDKTTVEFGPATDEFYHYVSKMKDWYAKGYVYQDFASRTNDLFYLPNTSLTYGGAAGVWMGLLGQTGTAMSIPEYNLEMNVRPITPPLDAENHVAEEDASFYIFSGIGSLPYCFSTACDEDKIARIMKVFDYLYSEEGSCLRNWGLNKEQAADNELYQSMGMGDGAWWFDEDGNYCVSEVMKDATPNFEPMSFTGARLPGIGIDKWPANKPRTENDDMQDFAGDVWVSYGRDRQFPTGATLNAEESRQFKEVYTDITDYVNSMIPKFIMGTEELTDESWQKYVDKLKEMGLEQALAAYQSALGRYNTR